MGASGFAPAACLAAGLAVFLAAPPTAWADPGTPYGQFRAGVPLDEIECRDGLVLMETNSGRPACVGANSAPRLERRGWSAVGAAHGADRPPAARARRAVASTGRRRAAGCPRGESPAAAPEAWPRGGAEGPEPPAQLLLAPS